MSFHEFNARLSSVDEKSVLFAVLRKVCQFESAQDLGCEVVMWLEWNTQPDCGQGGGASGKP